MWREALPCGWRSKTWLKVSPITSASGPKRSLMAPRWRPTLPLGLEKVGLFKALKLTISVIYHFLPSASLTESMFSLLSTFILFQRSPRPSWRTIYFSLWHCPHAALDQWWSRPCTHHKIRHWGQTLWWAKYMTHSNLTNSCLHDDYSCDLHLLLLCL